MTVRLVGFDGDDTLWFHEDIFVAAQEEITSIISRYVSDLRWAEAFSEIEVRNLRYYGYGVKSFILSAIETSVTVARESITAADIARFIEISKRMIRKEVFVIDGTIEAINAIKVNYMIGLITKGDIIEQHSKLDASGLIEVFDVIEIVRQKDAGSYRGVLKKFNLSAHEFVMVGNSVKSDIDPVLEIGAWAIHIPTKLIWEHENAPPPLHHERYRQAPNIEAVPEIIRAINN
jgi:putative hydrolase of the HAD superfamily